MTIPSKAKGDGTSEWQDISSAPKDGKDVLLFCEATGEQFVGFSDGRKDNRYQFATTHTGRRLMCEPSHWMPLPSPPHPHSSKPVEVSA